MNISTTAKGWHCSSCHQLYACCNAHSAVTPHAQSQTYPSPLCGRSTADAVVAQMSSCHSLLRQLLLPGSVMPSPFGGNGGLGVLG